MGKRALHPINCFRFFRSSSDHLSWRGAEECEFFGDKTCEFIANSVPLMRNKECEFWATKSVNSSPVWADNDDATFISVSLSLSLSHTHQAHLMHNIPSTCTLKLKLDVDLQLCESNFRLSSKYCVTRLFSHQVGCMTCHDHFKIQNQKR